MMIKGTVVQGAGQAGGVFGVQTANLDIEQQKDADGIYAAILTVDGRAYESIAFLGKAYLIEHAPWQCEVHILEGKFDLYNKQVSVELQKKLRDPIEFTSEEQAQQVIAEDLKQAKAFFTN